MTSLSLSIRQGVYGFDNQMSDSIIKIATALGLRVPERFSSFKVSSLLTDSRSLREPEGTLFFALRTRSGDGHRFIPELYQRGVRAFVVEKDAATSVALHCPDALFLTVEDSLKALQTVGALHRPRARMAVGITGSRGKTSLKEWLFQILSPDYVVSRSPRSYNSQIGVPLSLWEIQPGTDLALIEAGISRSGEMETLRQCIRPDVVILTGLGEEHDEGFPSRLAKGKEKLLLASAPPTDLIVYPADLPHINQILSSIPSSCRRAGWSMKEDSDPLVRVRTERKDDNSVSIFFRTEEEGVEEGIINLPAPGEGDVENLCSALTFLIASGYGVAPLISKATSLRHIRTRLDVSEGLDGCSVVTDSYTSDLSSLQPALDFVARRRTPDQSLTLIISDLTHETLPPESLYPEVAAMAERAGISRIIGVGPEISAARNLFPSNALFFKSAEALLETLSAADFSSELILLKGAPEYNMDGIRRRLEQRSHQTVLEVNLDAIVANYNFFRSKVKEQTGIVAMVKASGYGAGSREIAKTLQDCGAAYLAVAVLDEGIELRNQGITMPVMVMNPKSVDYRQMFEFRLEPEIYSLEMLRDVVRQGSALGLKGYPIHLKLDTGMHRMGLLEDELEETAHILSSQEAISVRSVFSHLATADCPDMDSYTKLQLERFARETARLRTLLGYPFLRHILNSAGILRFPEADYDMVRLGIGLYGVATVPMEPESALTPVSRLTAPIIAIRQWKAGESVGYARKGMLERDSLIATLPIGYADGMNRRFGNGAVSVLVNGRMAPTVGNICMDACMIDVTGIECEVGDTVEIFGPELPVGRLSDLLGTIPYEILTSVSPRVKRIYYRE